MGRIQDFSKEGAGFLWYTNRDLRHFLLTIACLPIPDFPYLKQVVIFYFIIKFKFYNFPIMQELQCASILLWIFLFKQVVIYKKKYFYILSLSQLL